jgi:hypothetical protein
LLRQSFGKIIPLAMAISLLTGGLAPANPRCIADCCVQSTLSGSHSKVKARPAHLVADCCSELQAAPCPRKLESTSELKDHAPSAVAPDLRPTTLKIAASSNCKFILTQSRPLLAARRSPQIRGPGVPIYLLTETFLI